jgi:hypothetical protein
MGSEPNSKVLTIENAASLPDQCLVPSSIDCKVTAAVTHPFTIKETQFRMSSD